MIETYTPTDLEKKSRRTRNVALGLVLTGLVVLFYVITLVKIGNLGG